MLRAESSGSAGLAEVGTDVLEDVALTRPRPCEGRTRLSGTPRASTCIGGDSRAPPSHDQRALLDREAPEHITLPGGKNIPVHYEPGKPPWVESRLQDFFGMTTTPTVARGRTPLTVHLLAPNQRAVQATIDPAGPWERHYPGIPARAVPALPATRLARGRTNRDAAASETALKSFRLKAGAPSA